MNLAGLPKQTVGVLVAPRYLARIGGRWPPMDAQLYAEAAAHVGILLYFFSWRGAKRSAKRVKGWVNIDGDWLQQRLPWPAVYYDQHKGLVGKGVRRVRAGLKASSVPINSSIWLSKWTDHQHLAKDPVLGELQPETRLLKGENELGEMLELHPAVLIKPNGGSRGAGISRVWRCQPIAGPGYCFQSSAVGATAETGLTLAEAYTRANQYAGGRACIVQQQVSLPMIGQSICDFRMMVNKDGFGCWSVSQDLMRISRPNSFTSNWHQQAGVVSLLEGLHLLGWDESADRVREKLEKASLAIATSLEGLLGSMGELGLDFGIDRNQSLWFFEANARPDKAPLRHDDWNPVPKAYISVLDYANYLLRNQSG